MIVKCDGVDEPWQLLKDMWEHSKIAAFFSMMPVPVPPQPSEDEFRQATTRYIDYLNGRVIKTDFTKWPELDPWGYDRDNGEGALEACVDRVKSKKK